MNESYKQIYATEKYVDDAINLTSQADWNQNDSTAQDYVKHRTHYKAQQSNPNLYPTETIDIDELGTGTHLIFKPTNTTNFLNTYDFSAMKYGTLCAFSYDYEYKRISDNSYVSNSVFPENLMKNTSYKLIDSKNYSFPGIVGTVFVILDISTLTEENAQLFPEIGIYLQVLDDNAKTNRTFTLKVFYMSKLSEAYIPTTIARTDYVDKKITKTIPLPAAASVGQTIVVSAVDENSKPTAWKMTYLSENNGSGGGEWTKLGDITVSNTFEFNPISFTGGVVTLDTNAEGYSFMNKTHTSVVFHSIDITANIDPVLYQLRPKDYTMGTFDVYNNDGVAQTSASIDLTKFKMSVMNIGEVSMTDIPDYDRYKVRLVFPAMATHGVRTIIHGNVNALTFGASVTLSKNGVIFENELLSFPYSSEYMVRKSSVNYGPFYGMNPSTGYISVAIVQSGAGKTKPVNGVVKFSPSFCPFVNGSRFELWGANDV